MTRPPKLQSTRPRTRVAAAIAFAAALVAAPLAAAPAHAAGTPVYDDVPELLAPHYPSMAFHSNWIAELGDRVTLGGSDRVLEEVTFVFVNWACEDGTYQEGCETTPGTTFTHPITVNVYEVGTPPAPGALLATVTEPVEVPFRPSSDLQNCDDGQWYDQVADTCYDGYAFAHTFDLPAADLPDEVIVSVAYNTQNRGADPIGEPGPYDYLNVALTMSGDPVVGSDSDDDEVYYNTEQAGYYADGGAAGVGIFRQDTGWDGMSPMFAVTASTPAPDEDDDELAETGTTGAIGAGVIAGALALLGAGLLGMRLVAARRQH